MSAQQFAFFNKAQALVGSMEPGVGRHQAATFIAYRLMMRGDCSRALRVLRQELATVADFTAIGGLTTGALTGRDPRCLTWVANRVDAVLRTQSFDEDQRAELRVQGRTMYQLSGWLGRAARMPVADLDTLDIVPDSIRRPIVRLEGLTINIERSDAPTRLETLLLDRLFDFRGTRLQLHLAHTLAKRAVEEPKYLSSAGWVEVALVLLAAGDGKGAVQLLRVANVRYMTLAGLEAEAVLRRGDYERAAVIFASNTWGTKGKSIYKFFQARPNVLSPHIGQVFDKPSPQLDLVSFSEALDHAGYPDSAKLAAKTAVDRFGAEQYGRNRMAQALARIGEFEAARELLAEALKRPQLTDPVDFRLGIAVGAGLAGHQSETERAIDGAPSGQRDLILLHTLAALSPVKSSTRDALEKRLEQRLAERQRLDIPESALLRYARGGLKTQLLVSLLERLERSRKSASLAIQAGNAALRGGHRETALAIADSARSLLPEGPQADAEVVALSELYWKLGQAEKATATAMQVSNAVGKVDAITRAFNPTRGESRLKLSFDFLIMPG